VTIVWKHDSVSELGVINMTSEVNTVGKREPKTVNIVTSQYIFLKCPLESILISSNILVHKLQWISSLNIVKHHWRQGIVYKNYNQKISGQFNILE